MKDLLKSILGALPLYLAEPVWALKHQCFWKSRGNSLHLKYFEQYLGRKLFLLALSELLKATAEAQTPAKIIELGCSGGNNYRLLRELYDFPVQYCGLDINDNAIAFARRQFPEAVFHLASDQDLAGFTAKLGCFDVFLASGVLYYLAQTRAQAVLNSAALMANYTLVCDDLQCFDDVSGKINNGLLHPYAAMCRRAGLHVLVSPTRVRIGDRHAYFIARSTRFRAAC